MLSACQTTTQVDVQPRAACLAFSEITDTDSRQVRGHNAAYRAFCWKVE